MAKIKSEAKPATRPAIKKGASKRAGRGGPRENLSAEMRVLRAKEEIEKVLTKYGVVLDGQYVANRAGFRVDIYYVIEEMLSPAPGHNGPAQLAGLTP